MKPEGYGEPVTEITDEQHAVDALYRHLLLASQGARAFGGPPVKPYRFVGTAACIGTERVVFTKEMVKQAVSRVRYNVRAVETSREMEK